MATDQKLNTDIVALSSEAHGDWSLKMEEGFGFARGMSAASLALMELPAAAREFVIVFAREGDGVAPRVVLGLRNGENLYVEPDGSWGASYVPAMLRQYPFVIGRVKDSDQSLLSIDQGYAGFNTKGEGKALFDANGEPSEFVAKTREFANQLATSSSQTARFCKTLQELEILSPMRLTLTAANGEKREITGFQAVSRDALKALPDDKVKDLLQSNMMELIFLHLQSLGNLRSLASRIPKKEGVADLPDVDTPELE